MNIMMDYDRTYTSDIALWRDVLDLMLFYGHNVYLVTSRFPTSPIPLARDFEDRNIPIIYCSFKAKRPHCESLGIDISIWIDDDPEWITKDIVPRDSYGMQDIQNGPGECNTVRHLLGEATEQGC